MIYSFSTIIGQQMAVDSLRMSFERNRLNHAYLLEGPEGVGRVTLARALAARYLCHSPRDNDACGGCKSCVMLKGGSHPDYLELPREDNDLGIRHFVDRSGGDAPEHTPVLDFMRLRPMLQAGKVCVIPDAERMNDASANAFLKTLEEPPENSLIILTTSARDRVLGTIVSRCRRVGLAPLAEFELGAALVELKGIEPSQARLLAALSEGSLGIALQMNDGEMVENWNWLSDWLEREKTPVNMVRFAEEINNRLSVSKNARDRRVLAGRYFNLMALYVRRALRGGLSPRAGYRALLTLWQAGEELSANVRPELVVYNTVLDTLTAMRR